MGFITILVIIAIAYFFFYTGIGKGLIKLSLCIGAFALCLAILIPGVNILLGLASIGWIRSMG